MSKFEQEKTEVCLDARLADIYVQDAQVFPPLDNFGLKASNQIGLIQMTERRMNIFIGGETMMEMMVMNEMNLMLKLF
jgi:hypothetical protein